MTWDWQEFVALGLVLAALVYLTRGLRTRTAHHAPVVTCAGGGPCAGCPSRSIAPPAPDRGNPASGLHILNREHC